MVRLDRTFSDCIFTGEQRSEGARCTSWMRFKHSEPHRTFSNYSLKHIEPQQTFSNYILTELARSLDFFHTSSGWFDWTEPSLTTSLQGIELVQGALCTGSGEHGRKSYFAGLQGGSMRGCPVHWLVHSSAQLLGGGLALVCFSLEMSFATLLLEHWNDKPLSAVWDEDHPCAPAASAHSVRLLRLPGTLLMPAMALSSVVRPCTS